MIKSHIKDIIVAINSVRSRAKAALDLNNTSEYVKLMADLSSLELCLTIEITKEILAEEQEGAA